MNVALSLEHLEERELAMLLFVIAEWRDGLSAPKPADADEAWKDEPGVAPMPALARVYNELLGAAVDERDRRARMAKVADVRELEAQYGEDAVQSEPAEWVPSDTVDD